MNPAVVVVGAGPAGYPAAIRAAQRGAKVTLLEQEKVGGTCLHRGCIPTKALLECVHHLQTVQGANRFGVLVEKVTVDIETFRKHRDATVAEQYGNLQKLLKAYKIRVVPGTGELIEPHTVRVRETGERLAGAAIILATGSEPALLDVPGAANFSVMNSDRALFLERVPERLIVVGGGYIGLEFAQIYAALGCQVAIVEMMSQILPGEDPDVAKEVMAVLRRQRIKMILNARVETIEEGEEGVSLVYSENREQKKITAQCILSAVGRRSRIDQLGLESVGVRTERGCIVVNEHMETTGSGIFAAGDCVGGSMLAHAATREGETAAVNATGGKETKVTHSVPRCLYTDPEVACIGLTEPRARELYGKAVRVGRFPLAFNARARAMGQKDGFAKIITSHYGEILGVHLVGPRATELIGAAVVAICSDSTVERLAWSSFPHPTISEILSEAASDALGECIHLPMK